MRVVIFAASILKGLLVLLYILSAGIIQADVPPSAQMTDDIIVSGRTSTAVNIQIVKVGQEIPRTYAGLNMANTPGFEWYVSRHFALKSQMDEKFSRMILEVSELALPHEEALTGLMPPDSDTFRMGIVYAKTYLDMTAAFKTDLGTTIQWGPGWGAITLMGNFTAYNFPSGGLQYHLRAIAIHENLHMLQGVATQTCMGTEGFTYGTEQHVYDADKKQLTVEVFDAAPINHWTDQGIEALQKNFQTIQEMAEKHWNEGSKFGSVYCYFFWSDPDRWFKWCIWRDEYYRGRLKTESNLKVMEEIFGPLDQLNVKWAEWVKARRITFHWVDWGWEQNGNVIPAYGNPKEANYWSQLDIQQAPIEPAVYDPLRMDYPAEPMPPIVGPVKRGVPEPSVGFVISGVAGPCWGGFGLGVNGRSMCQVVISGNESLIVEGKELAVVRHEFPLTTEVKQAAITDGGRYGVTIQIKTDHLEVTVRAGKPEAIKGMTASVPITASVRELLMSKYMTMVCRDGYPSMTPFIDDARKMEPDLSKPAPANRWRYPAEAELYGLYRAEWRLQGLAPKSLKQLKQAMLVTVDKDPETQNRSLDLYNKSINQVKLDIQFLPDASLAQSALAELAQNLP